jgi:hypothetical protein
MASPQKKTSTATILGTLAGAGLLTSLAKDLGLGPAPPSISNRAALEDAFREEQEFGQEVADIALMMPAVARQREYEAFAQGYRPSNLTGMQRVAAARDASRRADVGSVAPMLDALKLKKQVSPTEVQKKRRDEMSKALAALRSQGVDTPQQIMEALGPLTGGDPALMREASALASGGRFFRTGTAPGFVEDIGSLLMG